MSNFARTLANTKDKRTIQVTSVLPGESVVIGTDLLDYSTIRVAVEYISPIFRWPKEGETWVIDRDQYKWNLVGHVSEASDPAVKYNAPGDAIIDADRAFIGSSEIARIRKTRVYGGNSFLVWHGLNTMNVVCQIALDPVTTTLTSGFDGESSRLFVESTSGFSGAGYVYVGEFRLDYTEIGDTYFGGLTRSDGLDWIDEGSGVYQPRFPPPFTFRAATPDFVEVSTGVTFDTPEIAVTIIG